MKSSLTWTIFLNLFSLILNITSQVKPINQIEKSNFIHSAVIGNVFFTIFSSWYTNLIGFEGEFA